MGYEHLRLGGRFDHGRLRGWGCSLSSRLRRQHQRCRAATLCWYSTAGFLDERNVGSFLIVTWCACTKALWRAPKAQAVYVHGRANLRPCCPSAIPSGYCTSEAEPWGADQWFAAIHYTGNGPSMKRSKPLVCLAHPIAFVVFLVAGHTHPPPSEQPTIISGASNMIPLLSLSSPCVDKTLRWPKPPGISSGVDAALTIRIHASTASVNYLCQGLSVAWLLRRLLRSRTQDVWHFYP